MLHSARIFQTHRRILGPTDIKVISARLLLDLERAENVVLQIRIPLEMVKLALDLSDDFSMEPIMQIFLIQRRGRMNI